MEPPALLVSNGVVAPCRLFGLLLALSTPACRSEPIVREPSPDFSLATEDLSQPDMALLPACPFATGLQAGAPWPMRGCCPTHQGRSTLTAAQRAIVRWKLPTDANVTSSPAVGADGAVYVGSVDG